MWKILFTCVGMVVIIIVIIGYRILRWVRERKTGRKLVFKTREKL